jgi:phage I-like protein
MPTGRTKGSRLRLAALSSLPAFAFEFGEGEARTAPTEFRLFRAGENATDKGTFVFDDEAARLVLEAYAAKGDALMGDYEHQSLSDPPIEAPASATEWVPEVRNGELWATSVKWTDRARAYLESGEYRYFSPAFVHDTKTGRIQRLVNFALTNNPASHQLEPLVAATSKGDSEMPCPDCEAMKTELAAAKEKCTALEAKIAEFEKKGCESEEEMKGLTARRSSVHALVGKSSDHEALGALTALKAAHEELASLRAQLDQEKTARLSAEFATVLDGGVKAGKIQPAQKAFWEEQAKGLGHEKGIAMLKSFIEIAAPQVGATVTAPAEVAKLTGVGAEIAENMGLDAARLATFRATGKISR